jgi:hypothetical protein
VEANPVPPTPSTLCSPRKSKESPISERKKRQEDEEEEEKATEE